MFGTLAPEPIAEVTAPRRHSTRSAYLMMLGSSFLFACMSACSHAAGERCDWRLTALARAGLVLLFSVIVSRAARVPLVWRGTGTLWVRSLTGSVSMLLTFYALTHLQVATAVTLVNTFPLWVTLLAWPAFGERPTLAVMLALGSGIAGVVLIEQPEGEFRWASGAALTAAICSAVVMLGLHRLRHVDTLAIVVHFSAVATVFIGGFTLWTCWQGQQLDLAPLADWRTIALLLAIGLCATVGQILMTRAFHVAPPQRLSVIGLSQVLFALGLDQLGWHHKPEPIMLVGIALVVAPVSWLLSRRGKLA
jgi:drug/metabolite transporter (DMT)-like permease